jgi:hypothetical protein
MMTRVSCLIALGVVLGGAPASFAETGGAPTSFRIRQIASGIVYLDGGSLMGLAEGMRLTVKRLPDGEAQLAARVIGELLVLSVASQSAACEITAQQVPFQVRDIAQLSDEDAEKMRITRVARSGPRYAQVITFTEEDPLEEELRENVPRPPLPEVNRVRGQIAFEHSAIKDRSNPSLNSRQAGMAVRADMTRLGGTYWNFTGYWRGRMNARIGDSQQQTLTDLLSRTYHIGFQYNNPRSPYVAGFGRLYVPWASSLSTLDGGYFARRLGSVTTMGLFAGSTPDPTAWNYDPNRQLAGAFVNFEKGSFERVHGSSTIGLAFSRIRWDPERQFAFVESSLMFKRAISLFHNMEADQLKRGRFGSEINGPAVSRSFLTLRLQPHSRLALDINHNYFRWIPTFDSRLVGTGLVDRFLFQGLSGGVRLELPYRFTLYTNLGQSRREQDTKSSSNQMYGLTWARIPGAGIRADFRYSRFGSAFGQGAYKSLSLIRELGEGFRLEVQGGQQQFQSALTMQNGARFLNVSADWLLGRHYVLGGGVLLYRGDLQEYDQLFFNLGYRF